MMTSELDYTNYIILLQQILHDEIQRIATDNPQIASELIARRRLDALADAAPPLLLLLAGSYLADSNCLATLADCSRIHLYARILDDALDENLPVYQRHLLKAQPMFWGALGRLAINHASIWNHTNRLIEETVQGVMDDDTRIAVEAWGAKNHHLLLIPMLLTDNSETYRFCEKGLSDCIWLLQAVDEQRQGRLHQVSDSFLITVCSLMDSRQMIILAESGWRELAERAIYDAKVMLDMLPV